MVVTEHIELLAELQGETARSWQTFADAKHVSVGALLNELGLILREGEPENVEVREALRRAVNAASCK